MLGLAKHLERVLVASRVGRVANHGPSTHNDVVQSQRVVVHHSLLLWAWQHLLAAIYLLCRFDLSALHLILVLVLLLLLFYDILEEAVASVPCNRHISVLFKLGVVALRLLRNAVAE